MRRTLLGIAIIAAFATSSSLSFAADSKDRPHGFAAAAYKQGKGKNAKDSIAEAVANNMTVEDAIAELVVAGMDAYTAVAGAVSAFPSQAGAITTFATTSKSKNGLGLLADQVAAAAVGAVPATASNSNTIISSIISAAVKSDPSKKDSIVSSASNVAPASARTSIAAAANAATSTGTGTGTGTGGSSSLALADKPSTQQSQNTGFGTGFGTGTGSSLVNIGTGFNGGGNTGGGGGIAASPK